MGPNGWPEVKNNVGNVNIIISYGDNFQGYVVSHAALGNDQKGVTWSA